MVAVGAPKSLTTTAALAMHPLASVTVTLYPPATTRLAQLSVWDPESSHKYVYGASPPVTETHASPSGLPHVAGVDEGVNTTGNGSLTTMLNIVSQVEASVTVTKKVPAHKPVAMAFVWNPGSLQSYV